MNWRLENVKPYFTTGLGATYLGDALRLMKQVPGESVDLIYTGPPYPEAMYGENTRYGQSVNLTDHAEWITPYFKEMHRILKLDGSLIVFIDVRNWHTDNTAWSPYFRAMWDVLYEVFPFCEDLILKSCSVGRCSKTVDYKAKRPVPKEIRNRYDYIRVFTDESDKVLDPFGGMCTTGLYAENLKRRWMCFEISEKQLERAVNIRFKDVEVFRD